MTLYFDCLITLYAYELCISTSVFVCTVLGRISFDYSPRLCLSRPAVLLRVQTVYVQAARALNRLALHVICQLRILLDA
jgi:hypothetical protein